MRWTRRFAGRCDDDEVKVIVLRGDGKHFSAGHDIGTPGRDIDKPFERASLWWDHTNKPGGELLYAREQEVYLGMCRRWREMPKPTIAMVQGACIAGGLMLAWVCDLIVASEDASSRIRWCAWAFPGWSISPTCYEMNPRIAKEFLFLGERMSATACLADGHGQPHGASRRAGAGRPLAIAARIAQIAAPGPGLTKQAVNHVEDLRASARRWTRCSPAPLRPCPQRTVVRRQTRRLRRQGHGPGQQAGRGREPMADLVEYAD